MIGGSVCIVIPEIILLGLTLAVGISVSIVLTFVSG
jgi:hypothetical protein